MNSETITPALLSNADAAAYLAVSVKTLYTLTKQARIQAVIIGPRCKKYERCELDRFIAECRGGECVQHQEGMR